MSVVQGWPQARYGRHRWGSFLRKRKREIAVRLRKALRIYRIVTGEMTGVVKVDGDFDLWLANCYFAHDSAGFPVLLPFCNAQSGRSFHSLHLSRPKMPSGANAFEISDIPEDETEASQPDDQNVTDHVKFP